MSRLTIMAENLLDIEEDILCRIREYDKKATIEDFHVHVLEQTWANTSLGFGGWGGSAITSAYTYVFTPRYCTINRCFVYFDGRFAYSCPMCDQLISDIQAKTVAPVFEATERYFN